MNTGYQRHQSGVALILAIALLALIGGLAFSTFSLAAGHARALNREAQRTQARYLAEAGVEIARQQLRQDSSWQGGRFVWGPGEVEVEIERDGGKVTVTSHAKLTPSVATAKPMRAALRVSLQRRGDVWQPATWTWLAAFEENER